MLKNITSSYPNIIQTAGGSTPNVPQISGAVYWDGNRGQFKVMDSQGGSYDMHFANGTIGPGHELMEMIGWWRNKEIEEANLKNLCEQYPNLAEAKQEFDVLHKLLKGHHAQ